jgi:hypothetical protein
MSIVVDERGLPQVVGPLGAVRVAAAWSRVEVGPVGPAGVSPWGEPMPPAQAAEEGQPRVEVRLSIGFTPEELLAGVWDCPGLWDHDLERVAPEVARWYVVTTLVMSGGPQGPGVDGIVDRAYREGALPDRRAAHEQARALVERVFGVVARPALAVAR